jgi:hypothetical protein
MHQRRHPQLKRDPAATGAFTAAAALAAVAAAALAGASAAAPAQSRAGKHCLLRRRRAAAAQPGEQVRQQPQVIGQRQAL